MIILVPVIRRPLFSPLLIKQSNDIIFIDFLDHKVGINIVKFLKKFQLTKYRYLNSPQNCCSKKNESAICLEEYRSVKYK